MDKLNGVISKIESIDRAFLEKAQNKLDNLTKPRGSLGRLEDIAQRIVAIKRNITPLLKRKVIFTMAGDHGVAEEGVSAYPKEVTPQMVYNFINGGAAINVLARHAGCEVVVVDMGVAEKLQTQNSELRTFVDKKINLGTKNIAKGPAMTKDEAVKAIEAGIDVFEDELKKGIDIAGVGDMGIANTTPSSAIASVITGRSVEEVTGRGTGIDDSAWRNKVEVIKRAIAINKPNRKDPLDVLSKLGGFEIAGICGAVLAAAKNKVAIVADGLIATAGAMIAYELNPKVRDYLFASHKSKEVGHIAMLDYIGLRSILDLDLRLGEGTGSALAISIIDASCKILNEMATFESAGVSKDEKSAVQS